MFSLKRIFLNSAQQKDFLFGRFDSFIYNHPQLRRCICNLIWESGESPEQSLLL